ncbi:hypothetical protein POM88_016196 [Heracleum sosnowskyi]|uniref:Uncharacterized protein n=1 Tax=Heracleum sosnowskyi TaxID=360622 RepID=A0AAD8ING2_9APIA|nr:hypothetical protein POM88_016196 [Heracleum sosnowskyi]
MLRSCKFDKIYQFGDSLPDTGNRIIENPSDQCSKPSYCSSFFENPTGRCSDGLLMIDYIASAAGIPFLNPLELLVVQHCHLIGSPNIYQIRIRVQDRKAHKHLIYRR